jgi:hypothetical protein
MDLRKYIKNDRKMLEEGIALIRSNHLFYQPFILADDVEVGEGRNFCEAYADVKTVFDLNVYAPNANVGDRRQATDLASFRQYNSEYRAIYDHLADIISKQFSGSVKDLTFAEIGTNTGLNLFNMAVRGAKKCYGYDWNDMNPVFSWLNKVLGTNVEFQQGTYNNLIHRFDGGIDVPEVDVMINTIFTNHQCDPLQFLCYICDRARKGVFLWALTNPDTDECTVIYPSAPPHEILDTERPFPLYFNNDVRISEKLLKLSLRRLGFGQCEVITPYMPGAKWANFQAGFRMYYATRTSDVKSAYWQMRGKEGKTSLRQIQTADSRGIWKKIKRRIAA